MVLEINEEERLLLFNIASDKEFKLGVFLEAENEFPYAKINEADKKKAQNEREIWWWLKRKLQNLS